MYLRSAKFGLMDNFNRLTQAVTTPTIVENKIVCNYGDWNLKFKDGDIEGYVTNDGIIKTNKYKMKIEPHNLTVKKLNFRTKFSRTKAMDEVNEMINRIINNLSDKKKVNRGIIFEFDTEKVTNDKEFIKKINAVCQKHFKNL